MARDIPELHWYEAVHWREIACIVRAIYSDTEHRPVVELMPTDSKLSRPDAIPQKQIKLVGAEAIAEIRTIPKWYTYMESLGIMVDKGIDQWVAVIKNPVMRPVEGGGLEQVMDEFYRYEGTGNTIEEAVREVVAKYDRGEHEWVDSNPFK